MARRPKSEGRNGSPPTRILVLIQLFKHLVVLWWAVFVFTMINHPPAGRSEQDQVRQLFQELPKRYCIT
ncbi:hypothetical protein OPV22_003100 [Ensete ventricosum]|uniref:Uncharacterized protein n=1 Tax=Ensete ventricosum TaxID=4639 RepID=A0AAV8RZW9_ENSVE|nr:hypothetical protein OPV22_003100 [Ensete ventricosum]